MKKLLLAFLLVPILCFAQSNGNIRTSIYGNGIWNTGTWTGTGVPFLSSSTTMTVRGVTGTGTILVSGGTGADVLTLNTSGTSGKGSGLLLRNNGGNYMGIYPLANNSDPVSNPPTVWAQTAWGLNTEPNSNGTNYGGPINAAISRAFIGQEISYLYPTGTNRVNELYWDSAGYRGIFAISDVTDPAIGTLGIGWPTVVSGSANAVNNAVPDILLVTGSLSARAARVRLTNSATNSNTDAELRVESGNGGGLIFLQSHKDTSTYRSFLGDGNGVWQTFNATGCLYGYRNSNGSAGEWHDFFGGNGRFDGTWYPRTNGNDLGTTGLRWDLLAINGDFSGTAVFTGTSGIIIGASGTQTSIRSVGTGTVSFNGVSGTGAVIVASGTVVLVSGTQSITNSAITANSTVIPTLRVVGGTVAGSPVVRVFAGTALFTGAATDTSTWNYCVINP